MNATAAPEAEIEQKEPRPWAFYLVVFFRLMAVFEMVKGCLHWTTLLGIDAGGGPGFMAYPIERQSATIYFAILDLVAAVGLWLTASWGAVIWLIAAASQIFLGMVLPEVHGRKLGLNVFLMLSMATYVVLTIKAARSQPH